MQIDPSIFKDYDIRGTYPDQINGEVAKKIAQGIIYVFHPKTVAIIRDMRLSGNELRDSFVEVFTKAGVHVTDLGMGGTEMQYFVAGTYDYDLVLMISASHNPPEYNGIKLVKKGPIAITKDNGMTDVKNSIDQPLPFVSQMGQVQIKDIISDWRKKILSLIEIGNMQPFTIVVDAGNGMAGKLVAEVFSNITQVQIIPLYFEPDGSFPNHIPNPLVPENNLELIKTVKEKKADLGLTFDGDADRVFFIDDQGRFVSGTITTAMLAKYFLRKFPGELILYNAICGRIVPETIAAMNGHGKRVRVGHSYIKTYMRETGAIFAGEHSGHYYYRDFFMAESGILTALLVLSLISQEKARLSQIVDRLDKYPASGEINFKVAEREKIIREIKKKFSDADKIDEIDGVSIWYKNFWFNIRTSKTEPLLRLNVEADTQKILDQKTTYLIGLIESLGGTKS